MNPPPLPQNPKRGRRIALWILVAFLVATGWFLSGVKIFTVAPPTPATLAMAAKADLQTYKVVLLSYRGGAGQFPTTAEGLDALVKRPASAPQNWQQRMERLKPDPWGRPYQYVRPNPATPNAPSSYDLFSLGPDGVVSGDDVR